MGKIKKILENELIGGTQSTDVYPVTSTQAVYDENNRRLSDFVFDKNNVVNDLTTGGADKALSAEMGKELNYKFGHLIFNYEFNASSTAQYCEKINVDVFGRFFFRTIEVVGPWRFIITYADGTTSYNDPAGYINGANIAILDSNGKGISTIQFYMKSSDTEGRVKVEFIFSEALIRKEQGEEIIILQQSKLDKNLGTQNKGKALVVGTDGNVSPMVDLVTEVKSESDNPFSVSDAKIFDALEYRDTGKVIVASGNRYALVNLGVITTASESYYIRPFIDGSNDIDALPALLSSLGVTAITPIEIATEEVRDGSTFLSHGYSAVATRGGGYITGCTGGNYLYIQIQFDTSQNKSNNLQKVLDWLVVNPSVKTGKAWPTEYIAGPTISMIPAFPTKEEVAAKLDKNFGANNAAKQLVVGTDGNVTLKDALDADEDVTACVRAKNTTTLNLGNNLISNIVGTGTNWNHADGKYTHTTGSAEPLTFNYDTVAGKAYVVILYTGTSDFYENYVNVSIGDGELCDIYKGITGPYHVGIISDGGKLKITPSSNYASNVHSIELREVVSENEAEKTIEYPSLNVNIEDGDNLTGFWNIAIAAQNTMSKLQNGSRNIGIGLNCLSEMTSGERNIGIGTFAMNQLKWGIRNIAIGADALYRCSHASGNVAIGKAAAGFTHADPTAHVYNYNVAVGYDALGANAKNYTNNTALGAKAMGGATTGKDRTGNVAVGYESGFYCGSDNVSIGVGSNRYTTGDRNVSVGANTGDITETGSNNILIGYNAKIKSGEGTWQAPVEHSNTIVIGANAIAKKSNQVVIGNAQQTEVILLGNKRIIFNTDGTVTWESV